MGRLMGLNEHIMGFYGDKKTQKITHPAARYEILPPMNLGHLVFNWVANVTVDPHLQVFGASYST